MLNQNENTTDATRGSSLRQRVAARKQELEGELAKLPRDDRSVGEIELALNEVSGLLTGDLDHIPRVVASELNHWLEVSKHINVRNPPGSADAPATAEPVSRQLHSYDELRAFLTAENIPYTADPEHFAVQLVPVQGTLPAAVYVRWEQEIPYIQLIQQIAGPVSDERAREIESAISRINDGAKIPGFGFSYTTRIVYYRLTIPVYDGAISTSSLLESIKVLLHNAAQLTPALVKVIAGGAGAAVLGPQ